MHLLIKISRNNACLEEDELQGFRLLAMIYEQEDDVHSACILLERCLQREGLKAKGKIELLLQLSRLREKNDDEEAFEQIQKAIDIAKK